jgi:serine phosphatase RsbU (regulator of sigma subunit)
MLIIYMILIVLTSFFLVFGYYQQLGLQEDRQYDKLQAIVTSLAITLDGDVHEQLLTANPTIGAITTIDQNAGYAEIQKVLTEARILNELASPIYTLVWDKEKELFAYGVRSDSNVYYLHEYMTFPQILLDNMETGGTIPSYMSENGTWISAFHPIRNSKGEVVALLEADVEFGMFIDMVRAQYLNEALICFAVIIIIALILIPYTRKILRKDEEQKQVFIEQKKIIEEKNKDITDSINYALRIQNAILPPLSRIQENFSDSFVFYQSKAIVAGDFYWFEVIGDDIFIAAADCTGHGVPGAMVSVICSNALNRAVKEMNLRKTGPILDKVAEIVIETFEKSSEEIRDGMDICFCKINLKTMTAQYSGANNPLYLFSDDAHHIYSACKQPVGKYEKRAPYMSQNINIKKGDVLYLFTDGFADQFGGHKGKKLKIKALKALFHENHLKPMSEQRKLIDDAFNAWKGELEQLDDVCVIGLRI